MIAVGSPQTFLLPSEIPRKGADIPQPDGSLDVWRTGGRNLIIVPVNQNVENRRLPALTKVGNLVGVSTGSTLISGV